MALDLGKFPAEVEEALSLEELLEFSAWYRLVAEEERKAIEKARAEAKSKR